jgi:serine/threonine protein kinase
MQLVPGDKLGPYEVIALIGKGGMGEVYRATDTRLNRPVAIKTSNREFNDRFEREAHAIAALNHPNICTLYDVGPDYLVMEFVEGELLSKLLERGPLPLDKALAYATQMADALTAAHAKGVVHRDLKPGNVIITSNGAKVLDFGLAKLAAERLSSDSAANAETITAPITKVGAILGTLFYMPPEQVEGKEADERSDIFSFGVCLYEMLTAQHPFNGDTQAAVLAAILKDQPAPIAHRAPTTPRALDRIVRRCLEKKPEDRWRSADAMKAALETIDLDAPPIASTSTGTPLSAPITASLPTTPPARKMDSAGRCRRVHPRFRRARLRRLDHVEQARRAEAIHALPGHTPRRRPILGVRLCFSRRPKAALHRQRRKTGSVDSRPRHSRMASAAGHGNGKRRGPRLVARRQLHRL